MISSTGLRPHSAAPVATPVIAASLMGVLSTRGAPYFLHQAAGHAESSASRDIFTQQIHRGIARHFLVERSTQNVDEAVHHDAGSA
jgi:hypothetical protein